MRDLRNPRCKLAELIESHYGQTVERARKGEPSPPRLRLQDWSVLEQIRVGATDYVLLRRVQLPKSGFDSLTARERDAVRYACTGASNKEIAYQMGISPSTVRVLLCRASRKMGAADRNDLIRNLSLRSF
jgi:DNA-binding CsgD family transcriptional regulator